MPWCALSNTPRWSATAPVKAPFSCPNSVLSSRLSAMAPQFTLIMSAAARGLDSWTKRARTSLPAPVSAIKRTGSALRATRAAVR